MNNDKAILESVLMDKFLYKALTVQIAPILINAVPIDQKAKTPAVMEALTNYTEDCLRAMGAYESLVEQMANETDYVKMNFMYDLANPCYEAALAATGRITSSLIANDRSKKMSDITDPAAFTKEEYATITKNADSLTPAKIGKMIKDKTVKVILAEREAYEREEAIKQDLENALATSESNIPMEEYLNIALDAIQPREYLSFFCKLQEVATEGLLQYGFSLETEEIPIQLLTEITIEQTLDVFPEYEVNIPIAIEQILESNPITFTECDPQTKKKVLEMATVCAMIMYTFFEVCTSVGICKPDMTTIRKFVRPENEFAIRHGIEKPLETPNDRLRRLLREYRGRATENAKYYDEEELLNHIKINNDLLKMCSDTTANSDISKAATEQLSEIGELYNTRLKKYAATEQEKLPDTYANKLQKERDLAFLNKTAFTIKRKPVVESYKIDVTNEPMRIFGYASNGHCLFTLEHALEYANCQDPVEYLKHLTKTSTLSDSTARGKICYLHNETLIEESI